MRLYLLLAVFAVCAFADESNRPECRSVAAVEEREKTIGFLKVGRGLCSGVLLSPHVVLTAAHCVHGKQAPNLYFSLSPEIHPGIPLAQASEVRMHPRFSPNVGPNRGTGDLALVQLASVDYGPAVKSFFPLGGNDDLSEAATAVIVGYGSSEKDKAGARRSKHVRIKSLTDSAMFTEIKRSLLHLARGDSGELACSGDSGAPMLKYTRGRMAVVGVHSGAKLMVKPIFMANAKKLHLDVTAYQCRTNIDSFATAIEPFREWVEKNRAELETDAFTPCP